MRNAVRTVISLLLLVVFPVSFVMAGASGAMLYVSGNAMLNGMGVGRSSAVFAGDKIQTSENGAATLTAPGATIVVAAGSSIIYQPDAILLDQGAAAVNTTRGMRAKVDTVTVSPVSKTAKFEVTRSNGLITIAALAGAVTVNDGASSSALAQGQSTTVSDQAQNDKRKKKPAGVAIPPSKGAIVGMVAGAGAAAAIAAWTSGPPSSNTDPHR
jgi:hypothetical protein